MATSTEERTIYAKLEAMKDIRQKTIHLEKLKMKIVREVENSDAEEKCLGEYRREMELLLQEKMSHVEELRQIHADINTMESVIKQAEENRSRALNVANRMHEEYVPLKTEIDHMRREYLGLERLPELHEEEGSIIGPDRFQAFYKGPSHVPHGATGASFARPPVLPHSLAPDVGAASLSPSTPSQFLAPTPVNPIRAAAQAAAKPDLPASRLQQPHAISIGHPTFRQQPPPMKSCLSCHQQIHRNAPICPLCKAKSRSRNPKKPKKKDH
ncbi:zinc finger C4H2 domain-containing protein isoform X2 [Phlebotomus argentipes]|uniref:zinc finger C4H2 domain-containing protein isoform X2 n=1 Tax=Phlebotomus argentipes TaxID=94469 RepID=UPI002892E4F5|nr:zinc finger C4H2 domain-containing protein isoform X2 [Phlebotomus argentipes]